MQFFMSEKGDGAIARSFACPCEFAGLSDRNGFILFPAGHEEFGGNRIRAKDRRNRPQIFSLVTVSGETGQPELRFKAVVGVSFGLQEGFPIENAGVADAAFEKLRRFAGA